jgi:hypothetical protein
VGATAAAQIWERTGDIGLGMLVAAVALLVLAGCLLLYPRDRPPPAPASQSAEGA